jgi:hypothetical protein
MEINKTRYGLVRKIIDRKHPKDYELFLCFQVLVGKMDTSTGCLQGLENSLGQCQQWNTNALKICL